jgi:Nickel responsive protein SCO4226-like
MLRAAILIVVHNMGRSEAGMPRYVVERNFENLLTVPVCAEGSITCATINSRNALEGVTWVHSYVTPERDRTFCIYDAPSPEAIRLAAKANCLPVEKITEVSVLDPHSYRS